MQARDRHQVTGSRGRKPVPLLSRYKVACACTNRCEDRGCIAIAGDCHSLLRKVTLDILAPIGVTRPQQLIALARHDVARRVIALAETTRSQSRIRPD